MHPMQAPRSHASVDGAVAEAERGQLAAAHHAVLVGGKRRDPPIRRVLDEFSVHIEQNSSSPPVRPRSRRAAWGAAALTEYPQRPHADVQGPWTLRVHTGGARPSRLRASDPDPGAGGSA